MGAEEARQKARKAVVEMGDALMPMSRNGRPVLRQAKSPEPFCLPISA